MPDSATERSRRRRAHLRGEHYMCGPGCTARRAAVAAAATGAETVSGAVEAFAAAVTAWPADDPRRTILALLRVYAARIDAGDGDRLTAEFVVSSIRSLAIDPAHRADVIDEVNALGAARQLERLMRAGT